MRRETLCDKQMRSKPNYKTHNFLLSCWKQKCIQFLPPFHIQSYSNGALPGDASVGLWYKRLSLCACVWTRVTEGRVCTHACTTLFSGLSPLGDWWWEMSNKEETCLMFLRPGWKTCNSMCLCGCHSLKPALKTTLTSLGRGSLVSGWTWALGCRLVGDCWLLSDSSISPPDWWVLLKKKEKRMRNSYTSTAKPVRNVLKTSYKYQTFKSECIIPLTGYI